MKLSTEKETEIVAAYKSFWIANLSANMEVFGSYLVDDFSIIGSAKGETFFSRKDTVAFYAATAYELKDKAELRNRAISMQPIVEDSVIIHELCDLFVLIEKEWTFYGHARISCVMKKVEGDWKAVHQHASFPDHRTEEGQQLASEKIEKENLELKEAVHRRTVELAAKNRELEIQASLEKVRGVAMSISKPNDLLSVCEVLFSQLYKIGFKEIRCALIHIFKDERGYFDDYDYSDFTGGKISTMPYKGNKVVEDFLKGIRKSDESFAEIVVKGEELAEFISFRKKTGQIDDPRLLNAAEISYYFYSVGSGNIGISNFGKIENAQVEILKRFRNVFDLAYRRYLDIEQAMAQTREAQIEAALEKVRSRSLAMHKSDELNEVVAIVFEKLKDLHISTTAVGISLPIEGSKDLNAYVCGEHESGLVITNYRLPSFDNVISINLSEALQSQSDVFIGKYSKEEKNSFYEYLFEHSDLRQAPDEIKNMILQSHSYTITMVAFKHALFNINDFEGKNLTGNEVDVIKRFANVFDQAYTRFLDLQKAEAQTREAQIEAAVERVRAQSMAMHQTTDLKKVTQELLNQLNHLKVDGLTGTSIYLVDANDIVSVWDISSPGSISDPGSYAFTYDAKIYPLFGGWVKIFRQLKQDYFVLDFPKEILIKAIDEMKEILPEMAVHLKAAIDSGKLTHQWSPAARLSNGILAIDLTAPPKPEIKSIVTKMAGAFNQAYHRFLDLQKAEAQTREAEIELALERVRARTMAMQSSDELREAVLVINEQLQQLNIESKACNIIIIDKDTGDSQYWVSGFTKDIYPVSYHVPYFDHLYFKALLKPWKQGDQYMVYKYEGKDKKSFDKIFFSKTDFKNAPEQAKQAMIDLPSITLSTAFLSNGALQVLGPQALSEENAIILQRFAKVFNQTYTRFLDLQKAEAQTRTAQIELAVERVRAKALAMHSSTQILDVVSTLRDEMLGLEIPGVVAATIYLQEEDDYIRMWDLSSVIIMEDGFHVAIDVKFKLQETDPGLYIRKVWNNDKNYFVEKQENKDMVITLEWLRQYYPEQAKEVQQFLDNTPWKYLLHPTIQLAHGKMSVDILDTAPPAEMESILVKMGAAFDLAYKRFLDLQRSEAQIREGKIELALERVRARTMAMQNSDELSEVSFLLDTQVRSLGIKTQGCAFNIYGPEESTEWFSNEIGTMPAYKTPMKDLFLRYYEAGNNGETMHIEKFEGEACVAHYEYLCTLPGMGDGLKAMIEAGGSFPKRQTDHVVYFKYGYVLFLTLEDVPEAHDIFIRFGKVFEQTYTRFLDLQRAEAQAREAQIELSLERIRAQALAMRESTDLLDIVVTMRTEFVALGHEAHYFWHMRWQPDKYEKAMTSGDGTRIGMVMELPRHIHGDIPLLANWEKSEGDTVIYAMDAEEAVDYVEKMVTLGDFKQVDQNAPTLDDIRHIGGLTFIMARTTHGEIGFSLPGKQPEVSRDAIATLVRFAGAFDLAYKRFEDLKIAESHAVQAREDLVKLHNEKKRAEDALANLKAAQSQLVQSEKMASLGELTAGIAHEIQNPLNFVNNFSEVSSELLDEMLEEAAKGNFEEVKGILNDVKQNLEKINHHGKRADGIVKGMLQHSRSSSGTKEPTDINALADEYLRLAYHGLRAKDKSFNATLKTDYDNSIGNINIIPQDIGRVILNLITNAFYVVDEKKKLGLKDYEPTVTVKTLKPPLGGSGALISVTDNGPGIPQKVIDKIFQPFFTTKPTGQGTGLGLSLSYDIVKAHGGELRVDTEEGEGSEFTIILPV